MHRRSTLYPALPPSITCEAVMPGRHPWHSALRTKHLVLRRRSKNVVASAKNLELWRRSKNFVRPRRTGYLEPTSTPMPGIDPLQPVRFAPPTAAMPCGRSVAAPQWARSASCSHFPSVANPLGSRHSPFLSIFKIVVHLRVRPALSQDNAGMRHFWQNLHPTSSR